MKLHNDAFPPEQRFPAPSPPSTLCYKNMAATPTRLNEVGGDLSDSQSAFRRRLTRLELDMPVGMMAPYENRQAIAATSIPEVIGMKTSTS